MGGGGSGGDWEGLGVWVGWGGGFGVWDGCVVVMRALSITGLQVDDTRDGAEWEDDETVQRK